MKTIRLFVLFAFLIYLSNYSWGQESESITINNDTQKQQHERLRKEKAKAEQSEVEYLEIDRNATNSLADENRLVSKPYFLYRNQILDGMNVVGKGIIRKFDRELTNKENIRALNAWVKKNTELFKAEFLEKADEYFNEALRE